MVKNRVIFVLFRLWMVLMVQLIWIVIVSLRLTYIASLGEKCHKPWYQGRIYPTEGKRACNSGCSVY